MGFMTNKIIHKERGSVYATNNLPTYLKKVLDDLKPSHIFILTDNHTLEVCLPKFLSEIKFLEQPEVLVIEAGEAHKHIETCVALWEDLSSRGADRKSLLINLGGGVVTDIGGFVAATFKRGIEFIHVPTSLLAMVDASVGGKNGVDLGALKNQIGVIKEPLAVFIDPGYLDTLPAEHITSGYAEMLKHGLIHSEEYWTKIQSFNPQNHEETAQLIWDSVLIKNTIVLKDPLEKNERKTLNYGHTLGHAIESYCLESTQKTTLLHGEAIAIGMILATYISSELEGFPSKKLSEITSIILKHFPKTDFTKEDIEKIVALLVFDKKNSHGKVCFVLLKDIGKHKMCCEVPNEVIYKAFDYYKNF